MTAPGALLADLRRRGVSCILADGRLRIAAAPGTLTDADTAALREHRTALVALLGGEACVDLSTPSATVQHCNGRAENGDSELESPPSQPLQAPLQSNGHCNTPAAGGDPTPSDRCNASATAMPTATPDPGLFRVQNGAPEGGPLQRCTVAHPLEAQTTPDDEAAPLDAGAVLRYVAGGGKPTADELTYWVRMRGVPQDRARAYRDRSSRVTVDDVAAQFGVPKAVALAVVRQLAAAGAIERCPGSVGGTGLWTLAGVTEAVDSIDVETESP